MNWPTTVGVGILMLTFGVSVILPVRALVSSKDNESAAVRSQLQQEANMHEAERQRDVAVVAQKTAEDNQAVTLADNAKLHDVITGFIKDNEAAARKKIDAATGDDLVALTRTAFGVPNLPKSTASGGAGGPASGGGSAPAPAVRVPGETKTA